MKNLINTLFQGFQVSTSIALGLFNDKTYSVDNAQRCTSPAQYMQAIRRNGIGCNINNIFN